MKKLLIIAIFAFGFNQTQAMQNQNPQGQVQQVQVPSLIAPQGVPIFNIFGGHAGQGANTDQKITFAQASTKAAKALMLLGGAYIANRLSKHFFNDSLNYLNSSRNNFLNVNLLNAGNDAATGLLLGGVTLFVNYLSAKAICEATETGAKAARDYIWKKF